VTIPVPSSAPSRIARYLARYLGLRRNLLFLLAAIVLIGAGEELWMRFVPKYLESLGAGVFLIGLYDGLKTALAALYAYPGGVLADRWGHRRALMFFTALSVAGYSVMLIPHPAAVFAGMLLFLAWSNLSLPAMFSLVAVSVPPGKLAMGIGVQSLIKRVPIVVGPVLGGLLLDARGVAGGVRIGVAVSILLGAVSLAIERRIDTTGLEPAAARSRFLGLWKQADPRLAPLLVSDILVRFCERIPYAWVVIYAMDHLGVSATQVGVLTAIEMITAMACYVPVAHYADRHGREPFVVATFLFFTLFPLSLLVARSFPLLVVAFVIRGLKEFGDSPRKALIVAYAPATARGQTVGAYYLIRDLVVSAGALIGAATWKLGPEVNFWTAAALGAAGTLYWMRSTRGRV